MQRLKTKHLKSTKNEFCWSVDSSRIACRYN